MAGRNRKRFRICRNSWSANSNKWCKEDLSKNTPMDRLIFGDVGYGKTEVALRAAIKVAFSGGQVAVLAPTTILVQQHIETFVNRLENYPLNIKHLSRFVKRKT